MPDADAATPPRCEVCGRKLKQNEQHLTILNLGVVRTLCADCAQLVAPPEPVMSRDSPAYGARSVRPPFPEADPQAATVELPPPRQRPALPTPEPGSPSSSELGTPTPSRGYAPLRLALYVALAMLAGVVAGVLLMAILESLG